MIIDSGERREFASGAVRDIQEGKGRCDLLPLDVVAKAIEGEEGATIDCIYLYTQTGNAEHLYSALHWAIGVIGWDSYYDMFLDVAKHFEDGAKKYGEYNWQKGIPTHCYIDSAVRHLFKFLRGDTDERHDRAFVWNILCCIWTHEHLPELEDYKNDNNN